MDGAFANDPRAVIWELREQPLGNLRRRDAPLTIWAGPSPPACGRGCASQFPAGTSISPRPEGFGADSAT